MCAPIGLVSPCGGSMAAHSSGPGFTQNLVLGVSPFNVPDPRLVSAVCRAGGVGVRTAAAAVVGGAVGVVLDTQLALLSESDVDNEIAAAIRPMDGSETTVVDGERLLVRRGAGQGRIPVGQDGFIAARFATE